MSMDMWQDIYDNADEEFRDILKLANFNPCREPLSPKKVLHDGYRIDLLYNIDNARERAESMKKDYQALGYKQCAILTPNEAIAIDPFIKDFCLSHSKDNQWDSDAVAIWRPGGCLDAQVFLPKLYEYLKKNMGTYINAQGNQEHCFQIEFGRKVTSAELATDDTGSMVVAGLKFEDGHVVLNDSAHCHYVFCPGEALGTLKRLGFAEPAYAGFAGVSLSLSIDVSPELLEKYKDYSHCMESFQEGIVLPIQARIKNNKIFIGTAGTKAFYSDQVPGKNQAFAKNRNLLQLNNLNEVLPEFVSLALKRNTKGTLLTENDLQYLEDQEIAKRWVGVRAVVYDGFPTLGLVYKDGVVVENARCTTHLGSGGCSFAPAAVVMSRRAKEDCNDDFTQRILTYSSSARTAESSL